MPLVVKGEETLRTYGVTGYQKMDCARCEMELNISGRGYVL